MAQCEKCHKEEMTKCKIAFIGGLCSMVWRKES